MLFKVKNTLFNLYINIKLINIKYLNQLISLEVKMCVNNILEPSRRTLDCIRDGISQIILQHLLVVLCTLRQTWIHRLENLCIKMYILASDLLRKICIFCHFEKNRMIIYICSQKIFKPALACGNSKWILCSRKLV